MAIDGNGLLYIANYGAIGANANSIFVFNTRVAGQPPFIAAIAPAGLDGPTRLAFDSGGNLCATNTRGNSITCYTVPAGHLASRCVNPNITRPLGIAFDANGGFYVANNASVALFNPPCQLVPPLINFMAPGVMTIEGQTLFLGLGPVASPDSVNEYSLNHFPGPVLQAFAASGPTGLAFDNVGNNQKLLLVTDYYSNQVAAFLPNGVQVNPPLVGTPNGGANPSGILDQPEGISVDSQERVCVSNSGNNTVYCWKLAIRPGPTLVWTPLWSL